MKRQQLSRSLWTRRNATTAHHSSLRPNIYGSTLTYTSSTTTGILSASSLVAERGFQSLGTAVALDAGVPLTTTTARTGVEAIPISEVPKPRGTLPIIGNTLDMVRGHLSLHKLFERWSNESDYLKLKVGPKEFLLFSNPDDASHILQSKNYLQRPLFDAMSYFRKQFGMSEGLGFSNGAEWERSRSIANKTLVLPKMTSTFVPALTDNVDAVMEKWKALGSGKEVSVADDVDAFTVDSIGRIAFGEDLGAIHGKQTELAHVIASILKETQVMMAFEGFPFYRYIETPAVKRLNAGYRHLLRLGQDIVDRQRKRLLAGDVSDTNVNYATILLQAKDEHGNALSDAEIFGDVLDIIAAGQETTSRFVAWALWLISKEESLQERLHHELKDALGTDGKLTYDLVMGKRLPLLNAVCKETLRMYPPAILIVREAGQDDVIGKYQVPAKTAIMVSQYAIGRKASLWTNPDKFDPDRYQRDQIHPFAWIPFGAGRRGCIGMRTAMLEGKLFLAKTIQNFVLSPSSQPDPIAVTKFTLGPDKPTVITLKHRN